MADVVVIGAGILGLGAAAALSEGGARVIVVEKDGFGFEQTSRSTAAIRLPESSGNPLAASGAAKAQRCNDEGPIGRPGLGGWSDPTTLSGASAIAWDRMEDNFGVSVGLDRRGWNVLIVDDADYSFLAADSANSLVTEHVDLTHMIQAPDARQLFPTLTGEFCGLVRQAGGHVDRNRVVSVLQEKARQSGSRFALGAVAFGFEMAGNRVVGVRTSRGDFRCSTVLIAAGIWTQRLLDQLSLKVPMQMIRIAIGETSPIGEQIVPAFVRAGRFTIRQSRDGVIRLGAGYRNAEYIHDLSLNDLRDLKIWAPRLRSHVKGASLRVDPRLTGHELARALTRGRRPGEHFVMTGRDPGPWKRYSLSKLSLASEIFGGLRGAKIHRFSSGVVELTPDLEPIVGRVETTENVWVAGGMSGHGFMLGPGSYTAVADDILGRPSVVDLRPYSPHRFSRARQ